MNGALELRSWELDMLCLPSIFIAPISFFCTSTRARRGSGTLNLTWLFTYYLGDCVLAQVCCHTETVLKGTSSVRKRYLARWTSARSVSISLRRVGTSCASPRARCNSCVIVRTCCPRSCERRCSFWQSLLAWWSSVLRGSDARKSASSLAAFSSRDLIQASLASLYVFRHSCMYRRITELLGVNSGQQRTS